MNHECSTLFFLIDEATGVRGREEQDPHFGATDDSFRNYPLSNRDMFEGVLIRQDAN